jgi:hypothetical protein
MFSKGVVTSIGAMIGLRLGSFIASSLGIQTPALPKDFNIGSMLTFRVIAGSFFYVLLGVLFIRLRQKKMMILLLSFFFNYVVVNLLNFIEAHYFTTMISLPYNMISAVGESIIVAICLSLLFNSKDPIPYFSQVFTEWLSRFNRVSLFMRLIVCWLSFIIIYFAMGLIVVPIVTPYYQSGSFGLQIPSLQTIILLQLGRGALMLLFSLPLMVLWQNARLSFFLWFGSILFLKDVILGLLAASWFPVILRVVHGLELTADSFLLAGVYTILLIRRRIADS